MSIDAISWAFKVQLNNPSQKIVLISLANYANEDGECYPSQQRLAEMSAQSVDSVQRRLKELVKIGLLAFRRRSRKTNVYRILWENDVMIPQIAASSDDDTADAAVTEPSMIPQTGVHDTALLRHKPKTLNPRINNKISNGHKAAPALFPKPTLTDSQFNQFWAEYPPGRKTEKKAVRAKLEKVISSEEATFDQVMAGVRRYCAYKPEPKYTKAPMVWLNRGCWDDELKAKPLFEHSEIWDQL